MGHDDRREIFERLEALERMMRSGHDNRGWEHDRRDDRDRDRDGRPHHRRRDGDGDEFQEKRIIDTIVRLVSEQVCRMLDERQGQAGQRDGGDEKRIVDLIVQLVSEHVQEIVSAELDRRFGRAGEERPSDAPGRNSEPD